MILHPALAGCQDRQVQNTSSKQKGRFQLFHVAFHTALIATATTAPWSINTAIVMTAANLFAIAIGYYAIQKRGVGPALPVELPAIFTGFGLPELLATMSFGHLLGAGFVLGLSNAGLL